MQNSKPAMLVTGGSRGIGRAAVEQAINRGYNICINYTESKKQASELVDLAAKNNCSAFAFQANVGSREEVEAMYQAIDNEFGKLMSTRHGGSGGSIINISSIAALLGAANEYVDYAMSKGALDSMTIGLANEVAAEGIRVNAIRPGLIYTDIHASGGDADRVATWRHGA